MVGSAHIEWSNGLHYVSYPQIDQLMFTVTSWLGGWTPLFNIDQWIFVIKFHKIIQLSVYSKPENCASNPISLLLVEKFHSNAALVQSILQKKIQHISATISFDSIRLSNLSLHFHIFSFQYRMCYISAFAHEYSEYPRISQMQTKPAKSSSGVDVNLTLTAARSHTLIYCADDADANADVAATTTTVTA